MRVELEALVETETFHLVKSDDVPAGAEPVPTRFLFQHKLNEHGEVVRWKSRLIAQGFREDALDLEAYSPVCNAESLKTLLAVAATQDLLLAYSSAENA